MIWRLIGRSALALTLAASLGSCAPTPENCQLNQTATGALIGAGVGGALGAIGAAAGHASGGTGLAIAAGAAVAGAMIGGIIGHHQDEVCHQLAVKQALDQAVAANAAWQAQEAQRQAALAAQAKPRQTTAPVVKKPAAAPAAPPQPQYQSVAWASKSTNDSGTITPLSNATDAAANQDCMTYADQETVNGQTKTVTTKACRGADGEWKPVT